MSLIANGKRDLVTAALVASGGIALYLFMKKLSDKQKALWEEIDVPSSVYLVVKEMCKQSYAQCQVIVVESVDEWERAYAIIGSDVQSIKVLGMDTEWVTREKRRQPLSMLQLSSLNCTALVRLHILESLEHVPASLIQLLEDKSILKVGVGALDDRNKLLADYNIAMAGCVDLRHMAGRYKKAWCSGGLKRFSEEIAGIALDKSNGLRCGNWEETELSDSMVKYAAQDSQAGLAIFLCLVALKIRQAASYESTDLLVEALQKRALPLCHGIVDLHYKQNPLKAKSTVTPSSSSNSFAPSPKAITAQALRSKAMYSNCVMQAPDGQVLCVCDIKKAQWYCDKGLADKVSEDNAEEVVIRLRFEPRGRPSTERDYYRSRKENICVVCGADNSFVRKNIVPREYRKHFPDILKSHSSHDVVLLCAACHRKSGVFDQQYKAYFADLCQAPFKSGGTSVDSDLRKVKVAARTLNGYADRLSEAKLQECRTTLCQFYGTDEVTDDMLEAASKIDDRIVKSNTPSHGYLVVQYVNERGPLQDFERLWRQRFIAKMKPQKLHELWRVDYDHTKMCSGSQEHGLSVVQHFMENSTIQAFQKLWRVRFVDVMEPKHLGDYWQIDYDHLDYLWVKTEDNNSEDTDSQTSESPVPQTNDSLVSQTNDSLDSQTNDSPVPQTNDSPVPQTTDGTTQVSATEVLPSAS